MIDQLRNQILQKTEEVKELYYHLILLVNDPTNKHTEFEQLAAEGGIGSLNVNLELGRAMLPLTTRQRILKTTTLLNKMIAQVSEEIILMQHINILFDPALKQDPLRLLQNLSRRKMIIAAWDGIIQGNYLIYAEPDHPEYRRYPINDLVLISPQNIS